MFFYMRRLLLAVLFFNNQTISSINGNPLKNNDSSAATEDTKSAGFLNWLPKWCEKGYNNLFGDNGIITPYIPSFFRRPTLIECCCRTHSGSVQSTNGKDVRGINDENEEKKNNKCLRTAENVGGCMVGVGWFCGRFAIDACKSIGGVAGGLVFGAILGCSKLASCFKCGGSKPKPPKKNNSSKERT